LQASADRAQPHAEPGPAQLDRFAVGDVAVIQIAVGNGVTELGNIAVQAGGQRGIVR
jgi:hypothetical protein